MFALGQVWIGNYKVWVTTPVFTVDPLDPKARDLEYYEVMVTKLDSKFKVEYYVNLMEDDQFRFLFNVNEKKQLTDKTDVVAYNTYIERRSMQMPLWKLSTRFISQLFKVLLDINNKGEVSHPLTAGV
jgi:hypothetical protein